jgi:hypothetical protein
MPLFASSANVAATFAAANFSLAMSRVISGDGDGN